jgi:hypothetical protein
MIFLATKNGRTEKIFPPTLLVLLLDLGSRMDKNPGSATILTLLSVIFSSDCNIKLIPLCLAGLDRIG